MNKEDFNQEQNKVENKERVEIIDISRISNFPKHPFKVENDNKLKELIKSIKEYGVLVPIIVRKKRRWNI